MDGLKDGQEAEGLVTEVHPGASMVVSVQVSAFVKSQISFAEALTVQDLLGSNKEKALAKKFKPGSKLTLIYKNGKFIPKDAPAQKHEIGSLVVVRYVKSV